MSFNCKTVSRLFAFVAVTCLCAVEAVAEIVKTKPLGDWDVPNEIGTILVNGVEYGPDVYWRVTLKAGTVGSLFGDTMGPVQTFDYETVVTVDGVETLTIPGGTWSSNMGNSSYTVNIPLKNLGILTPEASGTHYLEAFTRNYQNGQDIHYSILYEDTYVTISVGLKGSVDIQVKDDMTHPDGVMLHVTGKLPPGTQATITRDGEYLTSVSSQCYLFDRIPISDSLRRFTYTIVAQPNGGNEVSDSESGSAGLARVGNMSITNENY